MSNHEQLKTISVPQRLLYSMIEAQKKWEEFSDELEDFLLSSDKEFIKKTGRARKEHLEGKTRNPQEI